MKISFWKRLAIYFVLSIIVMALMSFFADDSDARASVQPAAGAQPLASSTLCYCHAIGR
ncbi:hypothetical protein [Vreelandella subglaciescola]|jgi:hypothetical protein|uniref:Uncharacterized protein n=1 Tax=Vreelandella subglaciescola TaxID=29571 RepID=A0A1M7G3X5_9GAMM|nr:hypothetical protein [Halomonas subglaciescola]SHM10983.1 hypothetical protein SAMN05878437_1262 [Halomonas subglaciescola]